MNKVILMGRLTSDPKMDWTRSEDSKQYATYTLAVNRRFKKNGQADTDFISCIAWGAMAEFAEKFMKKGAMFAVEGRLNVRSWDDAEGKKHWTIKTDEPRTLDFSGVRGFLVTNMFIVQCSVAYNVHRSEPPLLTFQRP